MPSSNFISVVFPIEKFTSVSETEERVNSVIRCVKNEFADYEIILVDNRSGLALSDLNIPDEDRLNCYVLAMATETVIDVALLAGLERANGDYTFVVDVGITDVEKQIVPLYELAQTGVDITYVRNPLAARSRPWQRGLFYKFLSRFGETPIDLYATRSFLISRRALNAIIRNWTATTFFNEAAFASGYIPQFINVSQKATDRRRTARNEQRLAWGALVRQTNFPLIIGKAALWLMGSVCFLSALNAILVRFLGRNIFGQEEAYVPGWAFLVVLMSGGLFITNLAIYAILRTLYVILDEGKSGANYIVERYGRL
ncbi:MAG: hypothetical protein CMK09_18905 [Ponticaulis sp.]|nr:hypothetical protein [Ponticaulis sp.]|tara:strand:- start:152828 stop:153769 length:942 start_codon:yes stop_codon:yes gene_type:complete